MGDDILNWISSNIIQIIIILSVFIQISPIKWNPLTSLFNWIGKLITTDVLKKIDNISKTINELQNQVNTNEKDRIRWEVLDFARSCRNNQSHTYDEFKHIIKLNDKYQTLLEATNDKNGVFDDEFKYITDVFNTYKHNNNIHEE